MAVTDKTAKAVVQAESVDNGKESRKELVEKHLMAQACILFAKKGYSGTTLSDIAEAVGLTRAAVYYYFRNKEALLEAIMLDLTAAPMQEIEHWRQTAPDDCSERLRSFVRMRIHGVLSRQVQMRMIEVTEAVLPPELLARHTDAKRRILEEYRAILREGMQKGSFRAQDDRVAAFGIIGIVNWTTTWFVQGRGQPVDQIADQLADLAVNSVAVPADRKDGFADPGAAIQSLRENLDQLALMLAAKRT